jgi:AcrR family transcriptional regulator
MSSLQAKKSTFTKNLILTAAAELADTLDINDLSFKKVSEHAGISERTMFRYFSTRDDFLDAFAAQLHSQLQLPSIPSTTERLEDYVAQLYSSFDAQPRLVHLLLDAQLLPRIVNTTSKMRYQELIVLLKQRYPHCDETLITHIAANLRYIMSASTWRYYREMFSFDLPSSIQCASMVIRQALANLNSL